jgi:hypothetical protein
MHMNNRQIVSFGLPSQVAFVLILALLLWFSGLPFLHHVDAYNVQSFSDTLSESGPSLQSAHHLQFQAKSSIIGAKSPTLSVTFDPTGTTPNGNSLFTETGVSTSSSILLYATTGTYTQVANAGACSGDSYYVTGDYNNGTAEDVIFHFCSTMTTTIATDTVVTLDIGTTTGSLYPIINPSTSNTNYVIRLGGTFQSNTGDTRVAIVDNVLVTASVDTSFTFTVSGVGTGLTYNGTSTTFTTTSNTIPFGTLPVTGPVSGAQRLNVSTNASHGFVVTVSENQPLTDSQGDLIYQFNNGATTSAPAVWAPPTNTITKYNTYGHFGLTSTDDEGGSEFSGGKYVGNFLNNPRTVFTHVGPADGFTDNIGSSTVLYTIQIGPLQAAGNDYQTTLRYIATPTF